MATITFNALTAVDFTTLNTVRSSVDSAVATSYDFDSSEPNDIDVEGANFTYDGLNNLTGGTITRIDIDIASNQGVANGGDINISGLAITAAADLAAIDNGGFNLFGVALQGNDTFLMSGLSEDADTPTVTHRIFGDDLANLNFLLFGSSNTNTGGNDAFVSADNRLEVSGDAWTLNSSGFGIGSTYNGGNDSYSGIVTDELHRVAGDAWTIDRTGIGQMTLNGGDDDIDLGGNSSTSSWITGDVNEMLNGVVNGGDDELVSDDSATPEVAGDVRVYSGGTLNAGDDVITLANFGRAGGDVMFLNAPAPTGVFTITGGDDEIAGGGADDVIGGDVFDRNSTVDNLIVGGDDIIVGGAGDDDLFGEVALGDAVVGVSGGNDFILGGAGSDELRGQTGDDLLDGGEGNDTIDGGVGDDTLSYATTRGSGVSVNLLVAGAQNTGGAGVDTVLGLENLIGSRYGDTLRGNNSANAIDGGSGADQIVSGGGEDELSGGSGDDTLSTVGQTGDLSIGGTGDDELQSSGGGNLLIGGAGVDTVSFAAVGAGSTIDLVAGTAKQNAIATVDLLFQIENATGGNGADVILGTAGANLLSGFAGNDTITGGAGNDTLGGGASNDTLSGEAGNDLLTGAEGIDRLLGGDNNDTLNGGDGNDTGFGDAGNDVLTGDLNNDTLNGGADADTLSGGDGIDSLNGDQGTDQLNGGLGNDRLNGGSENDILAGNEGADTYTGGSGADTMVFAPTAGNVQDIITDFADVGAISDDLIDVTAYNFASVASITATANGNDAVLDFGGGDRVVLDNYLLTNTLANISPDDFLL